MIAPAFYVVHWAAVHGHQVWLLWQSCDSVGPVVLCNIPVESLNKENINCRCTCEGRPVWWDVAESTDQSGSWLSCLFCGAWLVWTRRISLGCLASIPIPSNFQKLVGEEKQSDGFATQTTCFPRKMQTMWAFITIIAQYNMNDFICIYVMYWYLSIDPKSRCLSSFSTSPCKLKGRAPYGDEICQLHEQKI